MFTSVAARFHMWPKDAAREEKKYYTSSTCPEPGKCKQAQVLREKGPLWCGGSLLPQNGIKFGASIHDGKCAVNKQFRCLSYHSFSIAAIK